MKKQEKNLDLAQKLMLLQGVSLIQDGLQFIEWADELPNELSYDTLHILRDRFRAFQEFVLDGSADHLLIDKIKSRVEHIRHGYTLNQQIQEQLQELREYATRKEEERKTGER